MAKKVKIAFLSFYSGSVNRGAEVFVGAIASRLSDEYDVTVIQQGKNTVGASYKTIIIPLQINWSKKDMSGTPWRRFFIDYWSRKIATHSLKALPIIWRNKYEVVIPVDGGWQPALVRLITWLYSGKVIISGQSGIGWDDRNNLWSFPNVFVAISKKAQKWAKRANPLIRSIYIPNGVNLKKFKKEGVQYKAGLKKPIVLCVGALTSSKRIDLVIKAVSRARNISLLVVGEGEKKEAIKLLGNKLLGSRFKLISVEHKSMPEVYRVADVFTLAPEESEAFGIVFVEAMASGLPVVTIGDGQRRDIVGKAGLFVDPQNEDQYTNALRGALDRNWGSLPRKQANKYDWNVIAREYKKFIRELVE